MMDQSPGPDVASNEGLPIGRSLKAILTSPHRRGGLVHPISWFSVSQLWVEILLDVDCRIEVSVDGQSTVTNIFTVRQFEV